TTQCSRPRSPRRGRAWRTGRGAVRSAEHAPTVITWGTGEKFRTRPAISSRQDDAAAAQNFLRSPADMGRSCPRALKPVATSCRETTTHIERVGPHEYEEAQDLFCR